jgi:alkanesulfonate monooxygenase SsuD/methylene tetrahydromethanopterin reductase-like flavin-dependent oxidoreductase (luciferase family)
MRRIWAGEPYSDEVGPIGPAPARPEILFGGFQPAALERVARWGDGFLAAAPPAWVGGLIDTVRKAWADHGRDGAPRIVAQVNVAIGADDVIDDARAAMTAYYAFTDRAEYMVEGMLTTTGQIREAITRLADLGADEVMLYCHGRDPDQVNRLADLAG